MPQSLRAGPILMLIVEDQALMRGLLREFVQSAYPQATLLEAPDGESALSLAASARPRIVLMDVNLPDANGIEVAARIRKAVPESAVIIVSQHGGHPYLERAQAVGAFAYITKERIYRDLLPTIRRALEESR